jgi:hypothetical protein
MFTSFLAGLLAIARRARGNADTNRWSQNLIRAIVVAFTLIVKSRPREAARHRLHSRNRIQRRAR